METIQWPTEVKARKNHKCNYCLQPIIKGSHYLKSTHKIDDIYNWVTHIYCEELAKKLDMYSECYEDGLSTDDFIEYVHVYYRRLSTLKDDAKFTYKLNYLLKYYRIN